MTPEGKMNPDIAHVEVGIRYLKELTVYPLAAAFQLEFAEKISKLLVDLFSTRLSDLTEGEISQRLAETFLTVFRNNVSEVLEHAIDPEEMGENGWTDVSELLKDMSTKQFVEVGEIIYANNYEDLVGKVTGFLKDKMVDLPELQPPSKPQKGKKPKRVSRKKA